MNEAEPAYLSPESRAADRWRKGVGIVTSCVVHVVGIAVAVLIPMSRPFVATPPSDQPRPVSVNPPAAGDGILLLPSPSIRPNVGLPPKQNVAARTPQPTRHHVDEVSPTIPPIPPSDAGTVKRAGLDGPQKAATKYMGAASVGLENVGALNGPTVGGSSWTGGVPGPTRFGETDVRLEPPSYATSEAPDEHAQLLDKPTPVYPEEARRRRIAGDVAFDVRITADGRVVVLRTISGLGYGLDESARDAVTKIRVRPARKAGRPIDVRTTVRVVFRLP